MAHPPNTPISTRAFWSVTASMSACVFGSVFLWESTPLTAATPDTVQTFACLAPYVHDGDNINCRGKAPGRLHGIDAPEMPGACRPGRRCTPGDPYASRNHLRALVSAGNIRCQRLDTDRYGRAILQCWLGDTNLSCAQVKAGHAVKRYGTLHCGSGRG